MTNEKSEITVDQGFSPGAPWADFRTVAIPDVAQEVVGNTEGMYSWWERECMVFSRFS